MKIEYFVIARFPTRLASKMLFLARTGRSDRVVRQREETGRHENSDLLRIVLLCCKIFWDCECSSLPPGSDKLNFEETMNILKQSRYNFQFGRSLLYFYLENSPLIHTFSGKKKSDNCNKFIDLVIQQCQCCMAPYRLLSCLSESCSFFETMTNRVPGSSVLSQPSEYRIISYPNHNLTSVKGDHYKSSLQLTCPSRTKRFSCSSHALTRS